MPSNASVHRALEGAREGTPTVLDIEGHAGFGKTHLIRGIVAEFPRERVLMATAYEDTQNDALGVLRQLGVDVGTVSPNALSASQALMRRIDALGGGEPVLLVIDDLHWVDRSWRR
ncbi:MULTISPECIES: ATP-binding protein [unclassified Microbacterium]|uniref:ATP-binding protein n=1 Tax=unclassified Microbacterium TaxID=2609290 RepID=UPI0030182EE3